jgi:hypothetical protein
LAVLEGEVHLHQPKIRQTSEDEVLASTTRGFLRQNFRIALTQCIMVMIMITIITITTSSMMHPIYITYERSFNGLIEWKPFGIQ